MPGIGPRRGIAKSRRVRVQLGRTDPEATNITMAMSTRKGVMQSGEGEALPSHSQNKTVVPKLGFGGKKVVVGEGAMSREYEMYLPGEDPCVEQSRRRNPCTFQMDIMEEKVQKMHWYQMRSEVYQNLKFQMEILQRYGVRHLVKDQERIPIIIQMAIADHSKGPVLKKLIRDRYGNSPLSQKILVAVRETVLESIQSSARDLKKFALGYFGEGGHVDDDILDLATVKSKLEAKMKSEAEFLKVKKSELEGKKQCCEFFTKYPAPREEPEELPKCDEFRKFMMSPQYNPQKTEPNPTESEGFNRIQKIRLDQLIHCFPQGVEENVFWKRFCTHRGKEFKLIDFKLKSPSEATELNWKLFHICGNVDIGTSSTVVIPRRILLPACAKPKSTLEIICETYHKLKLLVSESRDKSVNLRDEKIYNIVKFMEEDWGILGTESGVRIVLEVLESVYGENSLTIHRTPTKQVNFLCENSPTTIRKMESLYGVERKPEVKVKVAIPQQKSLLDVVRLPNKKGTGRSALPPMSSFICSEYLDPVIPEAPIKDGEALKCKLTSNYGHDFFALAIVDEKKKEMDSEKFLKDFREHEHYKMTVYGKPGVDSTVYQAGISVLAKKDKYGEYNRANILTVFEESTTYEVLFVDDGTRSEVLFSYVTSLPHALMKSPAMTVICSLRPGLLLKEASETGPLFQSILNEAKELKAVFHESHYDAEYKAKIWQVSLKIRLHPYGRWTSVRDELQRKLANKINVSLCSDEDSDNSTDVFNFYANDE